MHSTFLLIWNPFIYWRNRRLDSVYKENSFRKVKDLSIYKALQKRKLKLHILTKIQGDYMFESNIWFLKNIQSPDFLTLDSVQVIETPKWRNSFVPKIQSVEKLLQSVKLFQGSNVSIKDHFKWLLLLLQSFYKGEGDHLAERCLSSKNKLKFYY